MKTNHNKTARNFLPILKPRSHVSVLVESGDFSCCLACRPHASVKTVLVEKRIFSKTLHSRVPFEKKLLTIQETLISQRNCRFTLKTSIIFMGYNAVIKN